MAGFSTEIVVRVETRPCWYKHDQRAMFHKWIEESQIVEPSLMIGGHNGGVVQSTYALLELVTGKMVKASPEDVIFADMGGFDKVSFLPPDPPEEYSERNG